MFDKVKKFYKVQKQTKQITKELANTHIEAEIDGITVIINGKQELIAVKIPDRMLENREKLEQILIKAFNKTIKKSQAIAAEQMKDVMQEMGWSG